MPKGVCNMNNNKKYTKSYFKITQLISFIFLTFFNKYIVNEPSSKYASKEKWALDTIVWIK